VSPTSLANFKLTHSIGSLQNIVAVCYLKTGLHPHLCPGLSDEYDNYALFKIDGNLSPHPVIAFGADEVPMTDESLAKKLIAYQNEKANGDNTGKRDKNPRT